MGNDRTILRLLRWNVPQKGNGKFENVLDVREFKKNQKKLKKVQKRC